MRTKWLLFVTTIILLTCPRQNFGQAPNLGSTAGFVLFTGVGAITNGATPIYLTHLTGNVGSNSGAATGFGNVDGVLYSGDAVTATATADLTIANIYLDTITPTSHPSSAALGGGATMSPGVYAYAGAGTLTGNLFLDAAGDTNAVFIFQFPGTNPFDPAPNSNVILINGAKACNVFWKVGGAIGAISSGTNSTLRGTFISNGAINLYTGDTLEGRALSTIGAISVLGTGGIVAFTPIGCGSTHLTGPAAPPLGPDKYFAILSKSGAVTDNGTSHITGDVGSNSAAPTGFTAAFINGTLHGSPDAVTATGAAYLDTIYNYLDGLAYDIELLDPADFGHDLVLTPHTYLLGAATTLTDTLILNAEGDANAVFVFQVSGALSTTASSLVKLINGTQAKNVYWKVTGATTVATNSIFNGNIVGGGGAAAILFASGAKSTGRLLTTSGAITTNGNTINADVFPTAGPITGNSTVCVGANDTLSGVDTGGVWHASNTHATVISAGVIRGVSAGIDTIRYIVTNRFGPDTATYIVTVNPLPVSTVSGPSTVCTGSFITLVTGTDTVGVFSRSNTNGTISSGGVFTGATAGLDTITYIVTNTCGADTSTKIISVIAAPAVAPIAGPSTVCIGTPATMTDATSGGSWSSSNPARATVNSGGIVTGVTAGTATISYIVTNTCGADTATKAITVSPAPNAGTITGASTVCPGSTTTLSDATTGGTWSATNSHATVVAGVVTGITAGIDTIRYIVSNTCGADTATKTITVLALPNAGTISGPSTVCPTSTITLTDATTGGTWSASNAHATVVAGVVTGISNGLDTIIYTVTNTCGTDTTTKTINVSSTPNAGTISGPSTVCIGSTITLTDGVTGGVWTATNTHATVVAGVVTGISTGVDTIVYTVTNSCGTDTTTKTITVGPLPNAGVITGAATVCAGSTTTLTDATTGGTWSATNTKASVSTTGVVTGIVAGIDTIRYIVSNTCGADTATKSITVLALPNAGTISGPSTVCPTSTITLTNATTGGTWSASNSHATVVAGVVTGISNGLDTIIYTVTNTCGTDTTTKTINVNSTTNAGTISGPSTVCVGSIITLTDGVAGGVWTATNTHATVVAGVVTGLTSGVDTIVYTVTNSCGTDTTTKTITVGPLPNAGVITGAATVCTGSNTTLSDATTGGIWSATNTHATVNTTGVVAGITAGLDTIRYIVTNACGADTATKTINVLAQPNAGTISGPSTVCPASTITLTNATTGGTWSASNAHATVVAGVVTGISNGLDTIIYTVTNTCGTDTTTKTINVNSTTNAGTISGPSTVCFGSTITLTDGVAGGVWTATNTHATVVAGVVTGLSTGVDTIVYTVTNSCGTDTTTKTITVGPLPNAGVITGAATVCTGSNTTLSDATTGGTWSATNTHATVNTTGVVAGITAGIDTIRYIVSNDCGADTATKTINVLAQPNAGTISGPSTVCTGNTIALTDPATGGTWSASNTNAAVVAGIVTGLATGVDTIIYTVTNTCGTDTTTKTITVNPQPNAGTISGPAGVCVGSTITLTGGVAGGTWSSNNTHATVVAGLVTGLSSGIDTIVYTVTNSCGTDTTTKTITINPLPNAGTITGASTVCEGASTSLFDGITGGSWISSNSHATVSGGTVTGVSAGIDTIGYIVTNSCGSDTATKIMTINPMPNAGTISGPSGVCVSFTITLTDGIAGGTWNSTNVAIATVAGGAVTGVSSGTDTIRFIVSNSCGSDTASKIITVNPLPNAATITGANVVCVGATTTMTDGAFGGTWSTSNSNASISISGVVTGVTAGAVTIRYIVSNGCGIDTATKAITVNPLPNTGIISGPTSVCVGSTITLTETVTGGAWNSTNAKASVAAGIVTGNTSGLDTIRYYVTNSCGTDFASLEIKVNANPILTSTLTSAPICDSTMFSYIPTSDTGTATFTWTRPVTTGIANAAGSGAGNILESLINSSTIPQVVTYTYTTSANGCSTSANVMVTVNPTPRLSGTLSNAICSGTTFNYTDASLTPGTTFAWKRSPISGIKSDSSAGTGNINESLTSSLATPVTVSYVVIASANGCSFAQKVMVTVNPSPTASPITTQSSSPLCSGTMFQNFGTSVLAPAGTYYHWSTINGIVWAESANGQNALINFPNSGTIQVTLSTIFTATSCISSNTVSVTVSSSVAQTPEVHYFQSHFVCTPSNEDHYQWGYDDASLDSTILTGEINQDYLCVSPDFAHKSYWVMTANGGCNQKTYYNTPLALQNINSGDESTIDIYPNPANEVLHVSVNTTLRGNVTIEVINMTGQKISTTPAVDNKASVDVASLTAGFYTINCYRDGIKIAGSKFVKN